jgi:hypothetical protein
MKKYMAKGCATIRSKDVVLFQKIKSSKIGNS